MAVGHHSTRAAAGADVAEKARIARRLRSLRESRSISTRELGRRTGMSAGIISMIENEKSGVSLETLRRIAGALQIPVVQFFSEEPDERAQDQDATVDIVRRGERPRLDLPGSSVSVQLLTHSVNHSVEFVLIEFEPGSKPEQLIAHEGEEYVLVTQGTMHFLLGDDVHVLHAGDSMVFDCSKPHGVENRGTETLIQISAITPPTY